MSSKKFWFLHEFISSIEPQLIYIYLISDHSCLLSRYMMSLKAEYYNGISGFCHVSYCIRFLWSYVLVSLSIKFVAPTHPTVYCNQHKSCLLRSSSISTFYNSVTKMSPDSIGAFPSICLLTHWHIH